ncbi:STAS domain-containing protein [Salibacterium salarium]|uniref:STAS domain-containing protein n=1 Tax=Salibacterium salarium TaxID=284579 RepID=A0A428MTG2_9BACI|nr:STAS domain-containing protein [Salibacterium salarium]RSL29421.1 STAS domain-containing protein [Salibacterium salarium]
MQPSVIEMMYSQRDEIIKQWKNEVAELNQFDSTLPTNWFHETNEKFVNLIMDTLDLEENEAKEQFRSFAERLMNAGWPLSYFTKGMQLFRRVLVQMLTSDESFESEKVFETLNEVERWVDGVINQLVDEYTGSWENTLHLQKLALKELSAPLIPVFEKISVMPLVGTIDTERAKLIMENLLEGIIEHRSQVVLIDITGVPVVDTMVAHHIIQASEAVRLVGAECILVGIRPEIAQTIINLGIDLRKFPTKSTLRKGIETGLELTQRKIVSTS